MSLVGQTGVIPFIPDIVDPERSSSDLEAQRICHEAYTPLLMQMQIAHTKSAPGLYLKSCPYEPLRLIVHCPHNKGLVQVPMIPLVVCCNIHIHNVSILERPLIRNAMTDHL